MWRALSAIEKLQTFQFITLLSVEVCFSNCHSFHSIVCRNNFISIPNNMVVIRSKNAFISYYFLLTVRYFYISKVHRVSLMCIRVRLRFAWAARIFIPVINGFLFFGKLNHTQRQFPMAIISDSNEPNVIFPTSAKNRL